MASDTRSYPPNWVDRRVQGVSTLEDGDYEDKLKQSAIKRKLDAESGVSPNMKKGHQDEETTFEDGKETVLEKKQRLVVSKKRKVPVRKAPGEVNGSKNDGDTTEEDNESPNKIRKLSYSEDRTQSSDSDDMEVQEDHEDCGEDSINEEHEDDCTVRHTVGVVYNLRRAPLHTEVPVIRAAPLSVPKTDSADSQPSMVLRSRRNVSHFAADVKEAPLSRSSVLESTHPTATLIMRPHIRQVANQTVTGLPKLNHQSRTAPINTQTPCLTQQWRNIKTTRKPPLQEAKRGHARRVLRLSVMLLTVSLLCCLAYLLPSLFHMYTTPPSGTNTTHVFNERFSSVETLFPGQRTELWKRSRIHLPSHLNITHPTEPVSMILTAGRGAQQTLACLANHVASALASALNTSVTHVDGAGQASPDSDQVKLQLDQQLSSAFSEGRGVAVIHRFEELPPGSTLIFYRYCDHENSAFKRAALIFTILLDTEELETGLSLKEVEEMVQDHLRNRLVSQSVHSGHNQMDDDKFGGLWSRVSHLILPVAAEVNIEQQGCPVPVWA